MNTPQRHMLSFIVITFLSANFSCKQDISREAFAGLKLGCSIKEYDAALRSAKFTKAPSGRYYYTFKTSEGKPFYGAVYATYNADSIILSIDIYLTQHQSQADVVGQNMFTGKTWISSNLVDLEDSEMPSEEEIYEYIRGFLDKKYKVRMRDRQDISTYNMWEDFTFYNTDKDVEIKLDRYVDKSPSMGDALTPRGCISIHYSLTDEYIKVNELDNYFSRDADF